MAQIDPLNMPMVALAEMAFLEALRRTLREVFRADVTLADQFTMSVHGLNLMERALALHEDPLSIAAALCNEEITNIHIERYEGLGLPKAFPLNPQISRPRIE